MEQTDFLNIAVILVAIALIVTVLLQARGGGVGDILGGGGGGGGSYRTRRGVERTLFQLTIVLMVLFVVLSALSVRAHN